jgi:TonB family protein
MSIALLALMAAAAAAEPPAAAGKPAANQVSPLTVTANPKTAPPADVTVAIGSDVDSVHGQDVSIWPVEARAAGLSGKVTLACRVDVHGLAESCRVAAEDPPGRGFGGAAMALRPTFKLTPKQGPDGPEASTMNIAVNFNAKETQSNLQQMMAAARDVPADGGQALAHEGVQDVNARGLIVYHNPIAMRRVTIMDSQAWAQAPTFDEFAAAIPAQGGGVEGYAVAHCKMDATGALSRCTVAKETPAGHGFGKAAVALALRFRVSAAVMAQAPRGAPVEIDVPIRFPPASEANDRIVRAPVWVSGYDLPSLLRDFNPPGAKPVSPGSVVKCKVAADGALTACETELTSPDGIDYDNAAVALASRLRMNLWSAEAGPVAGGTVRINVKRDAGG